MEKKKQNCIHKKKENKKIWTKSFPSHYIIPRFGKAVNFVTNPQIQTLMLLFIKNVHVLFTT